MLIIYTKVYADNVHRSVDRLSLMKRRLIFETKLQADTMSKNVGQPCTQTPYNGLCILLQTLSVTFRDPKHTRCAQ
jgi:hypothetical protein